MDLALEKLKIIFPKNSENFSENLNDGWRHSKSYSHPKIKYFRVWHFSTCRHLVVTRVGAEFGRVVSPYPSTCRFVIVPHVVFLFVNVSFFHTATCAFLVGTCGVDVANFYSASCRLEVPTGSIFLLDHVSSLRVVSGLYVSVPYWTTCQFLIGSRIRFPFSRMPVSDRHVSETITCRRSYRSISSQNLWNSIIIPRN